MTSMKEYRSDYEDWKKFLNRDITFFMVGSGLGIISLSNHQDIAGIILFIFVAAIAHTSGKFPRLLKSMKSKNRTRSDNYKYYGILKTDFGFKSMFTSFLPYTLASLFITSILAGMWN